ncbi:MAG: hypothetical protein CVV02_14545 [Firmicutes bacterium HGW-Firmicutes-7]|nr:MAG: hypothetical protein CVV02_14545 [Firmicutes bacterium HGW-Firmicutes-7]
MDERMFFFDRNEFRKWLQENHDRSKGIWVAFSKTSKLKLLKAEEALEEALCFGWIDGQIISIDNEQYQKKYTPRRKGSHWSDKNKGLTDKLLENGMMTEFGIHAIEQAKKDGTWYAPKGEPITDEQVDVLISVLEGVEPALTNFLKMSPSVKRTYAALYLDAKKENTKIKRLSKIIQRLNENKKPM